MNLYEDNDSDLSRLDSLHILQPIRSFVEQKVDGGEVGLEAVFLGWSSGVWGGLFNCGLNGDVFAFFAKIR